MHHQISRDAPRESLPRSFQLQRRRRRINDGEEAMARAEPEKCAKKLPASFRFPSLMRKNCTSRALPSGAQCSGNSPGSELDLFSGLNK